MRIERLIGLMGVLVVRMLAGCGGHAAPAAILQSAATPPPAAVVHGGGPDG